MAIPTVTNEEKPLTGKDLKQGLAGSLEDRKKEDRSILITMRHGERPEVTFTGYWDGMIIQTAMNAISKGYRHRKHKQVRAHAHVQNVPLGTKAKEV